MCVFFLHAPYIDSLIFQLHPIQITRIFICFRVEKQNVETRYTCALKTVMCFESHISARV